MTRGGLLVATVTLAATVGGIHVAKAGAGASVYCTDGAGDQTLVQNAIDAALSFRSTGTASATGRSGIRRR